MKLHSYIVRYDSGFAPNPFFGVCTLATCKPDIRRTAQCGDWIVGTGSGDKKVKRAGRLVYAMRVGGSLTFKQYWEDDRLQNKKPNLKRSRMYACGDNIYRRQGNTWHQLNSFHSNNDGSPNQEHTDEDTGVDRVLFGEEFIYFGGEGPAIPKVFRKQGNDICLPGIGRKIIKDDRMITDFSSWLSSLGEFGYRGRPTDWILGVWK